MAYKRGCRQKQQARAERPGRVVCVLGRNVAGRWALVGSLEGKSSQLGKRRGSRVLILGHLSLVFASPCNFTSFSQVANEREPRFLLGACSSQCFRPLLPRFPALSLTNPRANSHDAAPACAPTACHIKAALSWQRPCDSPIGQTRKPASHTAVDWCRFLVSVA